jgi:hypothetical protein
MRPWLPVLFLGPSTKATDDSAPAVATGWRVAGFVVVLCRRSNSDFRRDSKWDWFSSPPACRAAATVALYCFELIFGLVITRRYRLSDAASVHIKTGVPACPCQRPLHQVAARDLAPVVAATVSLIAATDCTVPALRQWDRLHYPHRRSTCVHSHPGRTGYDRCGASGACRGLAGKAGTRTGGAS